MANDEAGLFMENLDEFIYDEDKIVTYKWLSRTLNVPTNQAKQMLYAYLVKQMEDKNGKNISATYLVGGRCGMNEEMVHQYVLTNDDHLDDTKSYFDIVTSVHIYSLQKNKPKDSNAFYLVDYDIHHEHQNESNRWRHIYCKESTPLSDHGLSRGCCKGKAGRENAIPATAVVNGQGPSDSVDANKLKSTSQKPKKGQLPTMGLFAVKTDKTSRTEEEKINPTEPSADKAPDSNKANKPTKTTSSTAKQASGLMSFFGKPISAQKEEINQDKPKEQMVKKTPPEQAKEKTHEIDSNKPAPKSNKTHKQNRRRIKNLDSSDEEEDPIPRTSTKLVSDSVSEDDEEPRRSNTKEKKSHKTKKSNNNKKMTPKSNQEENQNKHERKSRKRKKESKQASSEEESPAQSSPNPTIVIETPVANQSKDKQTKMRKRRKVMRSKTYVDDDGFMVTEKVYESESTDASDVEEKTVKQTPSPTPKKTSPDPKPKAITELKPSSKQAGIMSFFKKN